MVAITGGLAGLQVTVLAMAETPLISGEFSDDGFPVITLAAVLAAVVGALIVSRHPGHRIGWLFLIGQVATMFGLACQSYGFVALEESWGPRPLAQIALWVSILTGGILAMALMALLLLLAPDGRLLSPRWRWAVVLTLLGLVVHDAAVLTVSPTRLNAEARVEGGAGWLPVLTLVAGLAVLVGLGAGAVSLVIRTRRAVGEERAQLRWIGAAAFALAASIPLGIVVDLALELPIWVVTLPMMLAYLAVPVFTGVAILRFRLYDIDVLINRSLVLAMLTVVVGGAYVAVVVGLGHLVDPERGGTGWTSVAATVLVALGFQPMRRRVDDLADRLVYGVRAAPYEALAAFSDELRAGVAADELLPRMAEVTGRTLDARRAAVRVESAGGDPTEAEWSADPAPLDAGTTFAVVAEGERLGGLTVWMTRGRGLRRFERELMSDFADQLAPAFRTLLLEHELAVEVAELAAVGQALEESRRRLLSARATEKIRFEASIAREVLPHLRPLPRSLRRLAQVASDGVWPRAAIDRVIEESADALTSLRVLTRGVFPAQLERRGLVPALVGQLGATDHHLAVAGDLAERRFPAMVESAAYFCAVEALAAFEGATRLSLDDDTGTHLTLTVTGKPAATFATATEHLVDRAQSAGGSLLRERREGSASVTLVLPLSSHAREPDLPKLVGAEG